MKKQLLLVSIALFSAVSIFADEAEGGPRLVKNLYSGEARNVTWENTLTISAEEFAEGVEVGNYISISLSNATDVLELKGNGTWLPGTLYSPIADRSEYKAYITEDMLAALKQYGAEICGASFTVNSVDVMDDGFVMPEGAIWGGYFWIDNWNTLELWKTAFDNYDGQSSMNVNFSAENAGNSNYFMKVMTSWEESGIWADNDQIVKTPETATVDLKGIDVKKALESTDRVMVQVNPEGGNPFNLTSIVLVGNGNSEVMNFQNAEVESGILYNIYGMAVSHNVDANALPTDLPAGIYILNGRKYIVK